MNEKRLRKELCDTGRLLVDKGLVARTWGNLSVRLDENHFLITPSGRSYETLTPAEIVPVSLIDLSYTGDIKPSSEKNLHQIIYLRFADVRAIIHTHQPYASAVAAARKNIQTQQKSSKIFSDREIACAPYALPTTKHLAQSVAKVIAANDTPAILLANHGAVVWNISLAKALDTALELENLSRRYILDSFNNISNQKKSTDKALADYYVQCRTSGVHND